jgi:HAD superfamily hydrolase (TIGR01509 family)
VKRRTASATTTRERLNFNDVRLAIEEMHGTVSKGYESGLDVHPEKRGRMLFEILGIRFARDEEEKVWERAGRILSDSGTRSRLPHLNPEAEPMLRRLKEDFPSIKIGLISNAGRSGRTYSRILESLGIRKYFDSLTISCEVGFLKPRPEIFEHALKSLSVEPPEVLHVGDSFRADVAGAASFGMNAALYTGLWHRYEPRYGSIAESIPRGFKAGRGLLLRTIPSLNDIPKLVRASGKDSERRQR